MTKERYEELLIKQLTTLGLTAQHCMTRNEDAEDLLQDTMLLLLEKIESYSDNNFGGWSYTILYNLYRNRTRQHRVTEEIDIPDDDNYLCESNNMESYDIEQGIEKLSPCNATALKMYLNGYRYEEIASQLEISIGTVKSRISRSRTQLQRWLKDYR